MIRLAPTEPEWLTLFPAVGDQPAVEAQFAPITLPAVRAARRAVRAALDLDGEDLVTAGDALSLELIRRGLLAWRGVGDLDGRPLDLTPAHVEAFLNDHRTFEAADQVYVVPWLKRDAEGNAWSASPNGIGEAATKVADTASSAAPPETAAPAAGRMASTPTDSARTAGTSRKRKKGSVSGR